MGVRPTGGGGTRSNRVSQPSAQEQLGAFYGFSKNQTDKIQKITGVDNPFQGLPTSASKGEFGEYKEIISMPDTMKYFKSDKQHADMGYTQNLAGLPYEADSGYARPFYEEDLSIPGYKGPQYEEDDSPAALTVVPTSTTNPERPRTVAAGYDAEEEKITVVFRDGTFYNYYEVSNTEWQAFKSRVSKGQYIYKYLDFKPRGAADVQGISQTARKAFYKLSRASQISAKGKKTKALK